MMKLLSQSLFAKLLIISGSGTTLLLMAVFYGMWQMNNSLNAYEELLERQVANERGILRMQSMFKSQVQEWKNVLLRGSDPKSLEKYWGQFKESEELLQEGGKALLLELDHPEARQHIEQFLVTHSEMGKAYRNGLDEYKAAGFSAAVGDKAVKGMDREPAKLLEDAAALILATEEEASLAASQTAEHASLVALILMGVSIVLAFIVFFVFIKGLILRPISQLVENMTRLAGGDFSRVVTTDSHDEIGQLAVSAEKMRNDLGAAIREVIQSSEQLAQQAERLSHVADNTTAGISEQQQQTELEATAINEMTATVAEVARSAASAADAASQADRESREGKAIVSAAVDGIENLASEIEAAANSINSLEQESNSISQVLDVIRGIAEQTNLLALNAAIEAARAGEQGRGFAVVADEVRTLASRTQQSTQEIQAMIERLQSGTRDAVQVMNKNRSHAQGTVENAARAGAALESIANAVARINDMNNQIASASEEQGAVAEEINRNIVRISEVAETTNEGAQQIAQSSHELNELARRMRQITSRFSI